MATPATIKVDLIDEIETSSGFVRTLEFRCPSARDYFALGDPYQIARMADGTIFTVDKEDVIQNYMERCIKPPVDPVSMQSTSLANGIKMREAFLGFFAEERVRMSSQPATSSSST